MDSDEIFTRAMKRLRRELGMTQADLAEDTGLSVQMVAALEQGDRRPTTATIDKMCAVFGVQPSQLFAAGETTGRKGGDRAGRVAGFVRQLALADQEDILAMVKHAVRISQRSGRKRK